MIGLRTKSRHFFNILPAIQSGYAGPTPIHQSAKNAENANIMAYAGMLSDLNDEKADLFKHITKRRHFFEEVTSNEAVTIRWFTWWDRGFNSPPFPGIFSRPISRVVTQPQRMSRCPWIMKPAWYRIICLCTGKLQSRPRDVGSGPGLLHFQFEVDGPKHLHDGVEFRLHISGQCPVKGFPFDTGFF